MYRKVRIDRPQLERSILLRELCSGGKQHNHVLLIRGTVANAGVVAHAGNGNCLLSDDRSCLRAMDPAMDR
jgi:hypothetical protein